MQQQRPAQRPAGRDAADLLLLVPQRAAVDTLVRLLDVLLGDAPLAQPLAVGVLFEVRAPAEHPLSFEHRLVERQVLERMERVVVNEDRDGPLGREQVRRVLQGRLEGIAGRGRGIVWAHAASASAEPRTWTAVSCFEAFVWLSRPASVSLALGHSSAMARTRSRVE